MRVVGSFFKVCVSIANLDIFARDRVANRPGVFSLHLGIIGMISDLALGFILSQLLLNTGIAILLLGIQLLHKLLDIGHSVAGAVMLARGHYMFVDVHIGASIPSSVGLLLRFLVSCVH